MCRIICYVYMCSSSIPYTRYISPGENFHEFHALLPLVTILSANFFSCINDYTVAFTTLAKIKSGKIFM